jgi:hypothetical protein
LLLGESGVTGLLLVQKFSHHPALMFIPGFGLGKGHLGLLFLLQTVAQNGCEFIDKRPTHVLLQAGFMPRSQSRGTL